VTACGKRSLSIFSQAAVTEHYISVSPTTSRGGLPSIAGFVPGFTRQYEVDRLVYFEQFDSILEARAREHAMKRWRRAWKIELIEKSNPDWRDLSDELNA
jgi:putative endonuclease